MATLEFLRINNFRCPGRVNRNSLPSRAREAGADTPSSVSGPTRAVWLSRLTGAAALGGVAISFSRILVRRFRFTATMEFRRGGRNSIIIIVRPDRPSSIVRPGPTAMAVERSSADGKLVTLGCQFDALTAQIDHAVEDGSDIASSPI